MPHDSNKIYSQGEYGVSTDDVSAVIGVGSSDVGTLCTSDNINMWAKFKPVRRAGINPYDSSTWWKGEKGNCGIVPMTFNRSNILSELSKFTDDGLHGWRYERPTGGAGSPYRLADFNGYFHKALPPYGSLYVTNTSNWGVRMMASMGVNIHEGSNVVDTTDSISEITFQMLFGKPYIHPCYVIIDLSDDQVVPLLLQQEENDQHGTMSFDYTFIEGHTYKVYPLFYVSDSKDKDSVLDFAQRTLYTCTGVMPQTVTTIANLSLSATALKQVGEIVVTVSVSNVSDKDITLPNCYVWLKYADNVNSATFIPGEKEIVAPKEFTAKASATTYLVSRHNGLFLPLEDGMTASKARVLVSLDNGNKRRVLNVMSEADDKI